MEKITLMVHPFFYIKEDMFKPSEHSNELLDEKRLFRRLEFFENFRDNNKEIRNQARQRLRRFKQGIDFAKDGVLVVLRADLDQGYSHVEKILYDYASASFPAENLYFDPPINETRFSSKRAALGFLCNRFGSIDGLRNVQLYSFGESFDACVPQSTCIIHKKGKFAKPAIVLAKYSIPFAKSLDDAKHYVDLYFEFEHQFNPKRIEVQWSK